MVASYTTSTIAEMTNGIILASFKKPGRVHENYQTEADLERELISNLVSQGYERLHASSLNDLNINLKIQIERLNDVYFTYEEWNRFLLEYLDARRDD